MNLTGTTRGTRRALAVVAALTLVASLGLLYVHQSPHVVTVSDALRRFRDSSTSSTTTSPLPGGSSPPVARIEASGGPLAARRAAVAPTAPAAPADSVVPRSVGTRTAATASTTSPRAPALQSTGPTAGVYVYATRGYEETSALGGARHQYPAQSTVTVQRSACGWTERWQPLQERWDQWTLCEAPAGEYGSHFTTFHQFFQRSQQQDFDCPPSTLFLPSDPQPGQRWHATCSGPSGSTSGTASAARPSRSGRGHSARRSALVRRGWRPGRRGQ